MRHCEHKYEWIIITASTVLVSKNELFTRTTLFSKGLKRGGNQRTIHIRFQVLNSLLNPHHSKMQHV